MRETSVFVVVVNDRSSSRPPAADCSLAFSPGPKYYYQLFERLRRRRHRPFGVHVAVFNYTRTRIPRTDDRFTMSEGAPPPLSQSDRDDENDVLPVADTIDTTTTALSTAIADRGKTANHPATAHCRWANFVYNTFIITDMHRCDPSALVRTVLFRDISIHIVREQLTRGRSLHHFSNPELRTADTSEPA